MGKIAYALDAGMDELLEAFEDCVGFSDLKVAFCHLRHQLLLSYPLEVFFRLTQSHDGLTGEDA